MTTISPPPPVRPEHLMERARLHPAAGPSAAPPPLATRRLRAARLIVTSVLARLQRDALVIVEDGETTTYGPGGDVSAQVTVRDPRAWWHLATEGSIGLGRGYMEGWWDSDDPAQVVRVAARNMHTLDELRNRLANATNPVVDRIRRVLPRPDRHRNREDIGAHYDLGNSFFELFLDDTMTYSSGVFDHPLATMTEASLAKYDRLLSKLDVGPGMSLTEIGTGWGGLALRAAERFGARVFTTTISCEQYAEARRRVDDAEAEERIAPGQIRVLDHDWRDLRSAVGQRADRLVSIEMIEAVDWRDYPAFFKAIEANVARDGMVGLQAICVPDRRYERTKNTEDFIARFVFPGGFLPSLGKLVHVLSRHTHLQVLDVDDFGAHYAETLRRWRTRFDDRLDEIRALGLDDRFIRLWRFYLAYCEAAFTERHCSVNQLVLVGPDWRPDGLRLID